MRSNIINQCGALLEECDIFFNDIEDEFILPNHPSLNDIVEQSTLLFDRLGDMISKIPISSSNEEEVDLIQ